MYQRPSVKARKHITFKRKHMRKKKCSDLGAKEMTVETTMRYQDRLTRLIKM